MFRVPRWSSPVADTWRSFAVFAALMTAGIPLMFAIVLVV